MNVTASNHRSPAASIGIVGGMGPAAGLHLAQCILENTMAATDQQHLPVVVVSWPSLMTDRTQFVLGETNINPALGIVHAIQHLESAGARYIGIPCCTAHSPAIMNEVLRQLHLQYSQVAIVDLPTALVEFFKAELPSTGQVGLLCTLGAYEGRAFHNQFQRSEIELLTLDQHRRELVHNTIYSTEYGIKSDSYSKAAVRAVFLESMAALVDAGAEAILLGCTELGLVIDEEEYCGVPVINPTTVLARELIRLTSPQKLVQPENVTDG